MKQQPLFCNFSAKLKILAIVFNDINNTLLHMKLSLRAIVGYFKGESIIVVIVQKGILNVEFIIYYNNILFKIWRMYNDKETAPDL